MALRSVLFGLQSQILSSVGYWMDDQKFYFFEFLRASEGTLRRWSRLHLQSLAPTNPHWARVVGYSPFSLCLIHKEGLCPSSGDINRLMMRKLNKCWKNVGVSEEYLGTHKHHCVCVCVHASVHARMCVCVFVWIE
jgi:hypothetical protein